MANATLLVLAAGMGSRYGGLKQMDPVGPSGEAVLDYSVYDALRVGFDKVVFVIRRDIEDDFKRLVGVRFENKTNVEYVYQELDVLPPGFSVPPGRVKPWGTGHAVLVADGVVNEPFAVINADDFYGSDAFRILGGALRDDVSTRHYAMVGYPLENTLSEHGSVSRGVCRTDEDGLLTDVEELTRIARTDEGIFHTNPDGTMRLLSGSDPVSMNMWGFAPSFFGDLRARFAFFLETSSGELKAEFYIPSAVNSLIGAGAALVRVLPTVSCWFGVTYQEDRAHVVSSIRELVDKGDYPADLWA